MTTVLPSNNESGTGGQDVPLNVYLVSYDLRRPGQNYTELIDYLKSHHNWWHHLGSTWVIVTDLSATKLRDGITAHLDGNDKVLVAASGHEGARGGFTDKGSDWLLENL